MWSNKRDQILSLIKSFLATRPSSLSNPFSLTHVCVVLTPFALGSLRSGPPVMCSSQYFTRVALALGGCLGFSLIKVRGIIPEACTAALEQKQSSGKRRQEQKIEGRAVWQSGRYQWQVPCVLLGSCMYVCVCFIKAKMKARTNVSCSRRKDVESQWQPPSWKMKMSKMCNSLVQHGWLTIGCYLLICICLSLCPCL